MELLTYILLIFFSLQVKASEDPILRLEFFQKHEDCIIERKYIYLDREIKTIYEREINQAFESSIIKRYQMNCLGQISKVYILSDRVRSHYQTLLIQISKERIQVLEVLKFSEPQKYQAPKSWYHKFVTRSDSEIFNIDAVTGATLTRYSTMRMAKKALFLESKNL
ncbi:hypothetical protein A9Q84_16640 [Halobacteriovorax marinus]|uniref:FMN-binding domain-containing protein n=1 Tax=Halobacteriovorax marinus TaxID=97084 RepID=A0A1Y5FA83_9BACT|nr:hypothetical protein A9Q84_16640 [Halobacteriovorax marinus]